MKLFQFAQMVPIAPKFEWSCSITQIWLGVLTLAQMFLILCKVKWSSSILPKWEQSCLKFPKNA